MAWSSANIQARAAIVVRVVSQPRENRRGININEVATPINVYGVSTHLDEKTRFLVRKEHWDHLGTSNRDCDGQTAS